MFSDSEEHGYGESEDKATLGSGASDLSGGKMHRKRRILFTREQTYELQKVFQHQQYLTVPQRDYLSRKINLTPTQVRKIAHSILGTDKNIFNPLLIEVNRKIRRMPIIAQNLYIVYLFVFFCFVF